MKRVCLAFTLLAGCGDRAVPTGTAVQVSAGGGHTCAVLAGGDVSCWGWNTDGELGTGDMKNRSAPTKVVGLPGPATYVAAGPHGTTCAVLETGDVWCWGELIGERDGAPQSPRPRRIEGLRDVAIVAVDQRHACAVTKNGTVSCWGDNAAGDLGDGTFERRAEPVEVVGLPPVVDVATGFDQTCALDRDGAVWCWGANGYGSFGDGTRNSSARPVRSTITEVVSLGDGGAAMQRCVARRDGSVWCWGGGELKPGVPTKLDGVSEVAAVTGTCAITRARELWCWGGDNGNEHARTHAPRRIATGIVTASSSPAMNVCAVADDGALSCAGLNMHGSLGVGDTDHRSSLTPVLRPAKR